MKHINVIIRKVWGPATFGALIFIKLMIYMANIGINPLLIHINIAANLGISIILISFVTLFREKHIFTYLITMDAAVTFIVMFDLVFYREFKGIMNIRSFNAAIKYLVMSTGYRLPVKREDIPLVMDFLILPITRLKNNSDTNCNVTPGLKTRIILFVALLSTGCACVFSTVRYLDISQPGIRNYLYSKVYITKYIGNINFHIMDFYRDFKLRLGESKYKKYTMDDIEKWMKLRDVRGDQRLYASGKGKNLIIIQVESLSGFVLGSTINNQEITPNLNRLASEGIYFDNFYPENGHGGTSDAEFACNTSMYPVSKGAVFTDHPSKDYYSLAGILGSMGYCSVAMEADQPDFWNIDIMYRNLGFNNIFDDDDYIHDEDMGIGLGDGSFLSQSANKLESTKKPFYGFLVTLSSHGPFVVSEKYRNEINVSPYRDTAFGRYIESIHYADSAIGKLMDKLMADGLLKDSVIAIYGDHPVPLGRDNKEMLKFLGLENGTVDDFSWIKLQRIPFIIYNSGSSPEISHITGGHMDIMPTLLNIMGSDMKGVPHMGRDLLNNREGFAVSRNGYCVDDKYIYCIQGKTAYDIQSGENQDISKFQDVVKLYNQYSGYSDYLIKYNLIKRLDISGS